MGEKHFFINTMLGIGNNAELISSLRREKQDIMEGYMTWKWLPKVNPRIYKVESQNFLDPVLAKP